MFRHGGPSQPHRRGARSATTGDESGLPHASTRAVERLPLWSSAQASASGYAMSPEVGRLSRRREPDGASRVLTHLAPADRDALLPVIGNCPRIVLDARAAIPGRDLPDGALVVVEKGTVVVARPARGPRRRMIVALARQDAVLPAPKRDEAISALEDAALTVLDRRAREIVLSLPAAAIHITQALCDAMCESRSSLAVFGRTSHTERVREKLLQLAATHGRVVHEGVILDLPLTHAVLAEMIGSARETVSAALGELTAAGFVHREGRLYRLAVRPEEL